MDVSGLVNTYDPSIFLIHLHIQKTAGTTLQRVLLRKFGPNLLVRGFHKVTRTGAAGKPLRQAMSMKRKRHGYFTAHMCFGGHRFLPQPSTYFAFLREPVARIVSLYWHSLTKPDAYYHKHAKGRTLLEFVTESGLMELDNGQVRFICGGENDLLINRTPVGKINERHLEQAIHNIDRYFMMVGTVEDFDLSFQILTEMLYWPDAEVKPLNIGKKSQKPEEIPPEVKKIILAKNRYDVALYECARERLHAYKNIVLDRQTENRAVNLSDIEFPGSAR